SYERPQGIHVTEPKFSVTVKTTEGVANPDQLNRGVKQVNDGASQIISAAKTLVEDVLRGLTRPQKADMTGFHFKNDNGVATVDYVQGKQQIRSVYSDLRRETSTTQSGVTTSIADTFVLKNGKKTLFSSQTTVQAGNLVSTSVTSLQFQELQGGMFPSAIDQAVSVGFPGTQTSVKLSITFSDCLLVSTNLNQLPQPSDALPPGGGVSPPSVISSVKPQYPDTARNAKLQGTVVVEAIILEDGSLTVSKVVRGLGMGLDESAIDALKQWKFKPGMKDGKPVKVRLNIEVNFNLSTRATGK
ncbi:MAG TPA: energy transducer TonB, partial [Terriglobia bacterium]|nr:energy transducer TonB [Terriglobia bacterium]